MMEKVFFTFILLLSLSNPSMARNLEQICHELGGTLERGFKCPNTSFPLLTPVCFFDNEFGEKHFTDGCTGPSGGHKEIFLASCIRHDLCYHHEPASNGLKQKDCDRAFLEDLNRACFKAPNQNKCRRWASIMYKSLRGFGGLAFRCENKKVRTYHLSGLSGLSSILE
jgi:hypothetical protein